MQLKTITAFLFLLTVTLYSQSKVYIQKTNGKVDSLLFNQITSITLKSASTYIPSTTPEIALDNILRAFKHLNSSDYIRPLSDPATDNFQFNFVPTSTAAARYPFQSWNKQSEQMYLYEVLKRVKFGQSPTFQQLSKTVIAMYADSAVYELSYMFTVPHDLVSVPNQAIGKSQFYIYRNQFAIWTIRRWVDFELNSNDFTWSELKGMFMQ